MKLLRLEGGGLPENSASSKFNTEIDILRACSHQHIVSFHGAYSQEVIAADISVAVIDLYSSS